MFDTLNNNQNKRDKIIKKYTQFFEEDYLCGIRRFKNLSLEGLKLLIEENFIDIYDKQNEAPNVEEFLELGNRLMQNGVKVSFSGYAISMESLNYRVSIDTLLGDFSNITDEELKQEIENLSKTADEASENRIWWD